MFRYFNVIFILFAFIGCTSSLSLPEELVPFERYYSVLNKNNKIGNLRIKSSITNLNNTLSIETSLLFTAKKKYNFLMDSFLSTIVSVSNKFSFFEAINGDPVLVNNSDRAAHVNTKAYLKLMRRRLGVLFYRYNGANAKGKDKFVEEKMKITKQSVISALPNTDIAWIFKDGLIAKHSRMKNEIISNTIPIGNEKVILPLKFRDIVYKMNKEKVAQCDFLLFFPPAAAKPVRVEVELTSLTNNNYLKCRISASDIGGLNYEIIFDNKIIPLKITASNWEAVSITNKK